MNNQEAYNLWAGSYDVVVNKTRDIEALALKAMLGKIDLSKSAVLEIGCGTGKNTAWLHPMADHLVGADFSEQMLNQARKKITGNNVEFQQLDIRKPWPFPEQNFDLVTCSLILEHIEDLNFVFSQARSVLKTGGFFYLGELHPFKQYQGSKARFDSGEGVVELECFVHHISDYFESASSNNFNCISINEWFDDNDRTAIPRLITMLFRL